MFCTHCGKQIFTNAKFCDGCGALVSDKMIQSSTIATEQNFVQAEKNLSENISKREETEGEFLKKEKCCQMFSEEIYKCPACGEAINAFDAKCPACGFAFEGKRINQALTEFIDKIGELEKSIAEESEVYKTGWSAWGKGKRFWWVVLNIFCACIPLAIYLALPLITIKIVPKLTPKEMQLASLIENFTVPNDRDSLLSVLIFAKEKIALITQKSINSKTVYWMNLWCAKVSQFSQKATLLLGYDAKIENECNAVRANEQRVQKTIKIKAIIGSVILVVAVIFWVTR